MNITKYRVELRQFANGLSASVEVISISEKCASDLVRRKFFPRGNWEVVKVSKVAELS